MKMSNYIILSRFLKAEVAGYQCKVMFKQHWLYEPIVPILNDNNLEEVLNDLGFTAAKKNKEKNYRQIFPVVRGKQDLDTASDLQAAFSKIEKE